MTTPVSIRVFVLDLNGSEDTVQSVRTLLDQGDLPAKVSILLNGSAPEHVARVEQAFSGHPDIEIHRSDRNLGFCGGNNYLLQQLPVGEKDANYLLFLNNDVQTTPGALTALVAALDANPGAGVVGPRILLPGEAGVIAEDVLHVWPGIVQHRSPNRGRLDADCPPGRATRVPFVTGACMMTRTALFRDLGGFDERYFAYFEDWDYCLRAAVRGNDVLHVAASRVTHKEGSTLGRRSEAYQFLMTRNRWLMAQTHLSPAAFALAFLPYFVLVKVVYRVLVLVLGGHAPGARGILRACAWLIAPARAKASLWPRAALGGGEMPRGST